MEEEILKIQDILEILKKRITMVISIVLMFTIGAIIISFFILEPKYTTSAKLFVGKQDGENSSYQNSDVQMYQNLMKTYAGVLESEDVVAKAIEKGNLPFTPKEVLNALTVTPGTDDQFLSLSIKTKNKEDGVKILEPLIDVFIETTDSYIVNSNVQVLTTPKVPTVPSSPNKKLNILIGFFAGLLVSIGVAVALDYMDNSVKRKEDIEKLLGVSVIGTVPEYTEKSKRN
ncbi:MAG: YveK family protein [Clostridium sp.]